MNTMGDDVATTRPIDKSDVLGEMERWTLHRLADCHIADQNELREFYSQYQESRRNDFGSDLLYAFLKQRRFSHQQKDEVAYQIMPREERLVRCDFIQRPSRPEISNDFRIHVRMIDRCGAILLFAGELRLLIAGFNPATTIMLRQWLADCPISSRVLPYVGAMWLSAESYHRLCLSRYGSHGS